MRRGLRIIWIFVGRRPPSCLSKIFVSQRLSVSKFLFVTRRHCDVCATVHLWFLRCRSCVDIIDTRARTVTINLWICGGSEWLIKQTYHQLNITDRYYLCRYYSSLSSPSMWVEANHKACKTSTRTAKLVHNGNIRVFWRIRSRPRMATLLVRVDANYNARKSSTRVQKGNVQVSYHRRKVEALICCVAWILGSKVV